MKMVNLAGASLWLETTVVFNDQDDDMHNFPTSGWNIVMRQRLRQIYLPI